MKEGQIIDVAEPAWLRQTDPFELFGEWYEHMVASGLIAEPTAMHVSTASRGGKPSARILLLKGYDRRGFTFFTNTRSRKGGDLAENPQAALCFFWMPLSRQIRIEGRVEPVSPDEADAYYRSRPRGSQIGAWASQQSQPLPERALLVERVNRITEEYEGREVSRPPHWSGYRVIPERLEFWEEAPYRLHYRRLFERDGDGWKTGMLYP